MKNQTMDLKSFELEAINTKELEVTSGGNPYFIGFACGWLGTILYECVNDWDRNIAAYKSGYNSVRNK
jgi:hypothetical protein